MDWRRIGWGLGGGCSPHEQSKAIIFLENAIYKFFGQKPAAKMKKIYLYLFNEKTALIPSSEMKCPKSRIFTNNYFVGRVGQSNFAR